MYLCLSESLTIRDFQTGIKKRKKLINSILKNYPIHSIICSKHHLISGNSVKEYLDIEDGQTRLSILESYYNNDFLMNMVILLMNLRLLNNVLLKIMKYQWM